MLDNCCSSSSRQKSFSSNRLTSKKSQNKICKAMRISKFRLLTMAKKAKSNTNRSPKVVPSCRKRRTNITMMTSRRLWLVNSNRRKKQKKSSILMLISKNIIRSSSNRILNSNICRKISQSTTMKIKTWSKSMFQLNKRRKSLKRKRMLSNNLRCMMTTKEINNSTSKLKRSWMLMLQKKAKKSYKRS